MPDLRADERGNRGRGEALELAELRRHRGRGGDEHAGQLVFQDGARPLLVRRVEVGEQEADGDRLDALVLELARRLAYVVLIERHQHLAPGRHQALRDRLRWRRRTSGRSCQGTSCMIE